MNLNLGFKAHTSSVVRYWAFVDKRYQDEWINMAPITCTRARPFIFLLDCRGALDGPVVSLVSRQPLALIFWIPYFIQGLQNGDILALSFPLH